MSGNVEPVVICHGGAWSGCSFQRDARAVGAKVAAIAGWKKLLETGNALDAAEECVRALEDDPIFDAGITCCVSCNQTNGRSACSPVVILPLFYVTVQV